MTGPPPLDPLEKAVVLISRNFLPVNAFRRDTGTGLKTECLATPCTNSESASTKHPHHVGLKATRGAQRFQNVALGNINALICTSSTVTPNTKMNSLDEF